jgi:glucosylglycerate synthase
VQENTAQAGAATARPDVVIGVLAHSDRLAASEAALRVEAQLRVAFPSRSGLAIVLTPDAHGAAAPGEPLVRSSDGSPFRVHTGGHGGPEAGLQSLLEVVLAQGAPACALIDPVARDDDARWLRHLLDPIVEGGYDLACPTYARSRLEGLLNTGLAYPLTRALFGQRLRQPLGPEIALSNGLAETLLRDLDWPTQGATGPSDLWIVTKALARGVKLCQAWLGPMPPRAEKAPDVAHALANVLGIVFREMERHAPRWQRVTGSAPVPTFGVPSPVEEHAPPGVASLLSAFVLGWQDLRAIWSAVLPPHALLALQRLPRDPPESFRMPDALWARVVYDFAVGWRTKAMDRNQLLLSMTPLYLGWVASWINEVGALDADAAEARLERLCEAFEQEKRYLISRWRWPDRFNP